MNSSPNCEVTIANRYAKMDAVSYPLEKFPSCEDPDGDVVTYYLKTPPKYGDLQDCLGLSITPVTTYLEKHTDLSCLFTARKSYEGSDQIIYVATDGKGGETALTVNLTISKNNTPKAYVGQVIQIDRSLGPQNIDAIQAATDADKGDILSYALKTLPSKGDLSYCLGLNGTSNDDMSCIYSPNQTGSDSFSYIVTDGSGATDTGTVTLKEVNADGPTLITPYSVYVKMNNGTQKFKTDDTFSADKNLTTTSNPFGDVLTYKLKTAPTYGTLENCLDLTGAVEPSPDMDCLYTPNHGFQGNDLLIYEVTDPAGNSITTQVTIVVYNAPPVGFSGTYYPTEDLGPQVVNITPITDNEGQLYKVVGISPVNTSNEFDGKLANGTLTDCLGLVGSTSLTDSNCLYTPNPDFNGIETFSYRAIDAQGAYQDYVITLFVLNLPDNPIWESQTAKVRESNGAQSITFQGATAVDAGATNFSYSVITAPATGTLSDCMGLTGSNADDLTCNYSPVVNVVGDVTFDAQVDDGVGGTTSTTMTISIISNNQKPVFPQSEVSFIAPENTDGTGVTTNFDIPAGTDPDAGDTLTYILTKSPKGTLSSCNAEMDCDYLPPIGLWGDNADYYEVSVFDDESFFSTLKVYVDITQNNQHPSFPVASISLNVDEYPGTPMPLSGSITAATDPDPNDTLEYSLDIYPQRGTLLNCLGLNGSSKSDLLCDYTIDPTIIDHFDILAAPYDQFRVKVKDGEGGEDTLLVEINVLPINSNPKIVSGLNNLSFTKNTPIQFKVVVDEGGGLDENSQLLTVQIMSDQSIVKTSGVTILFGSSIDTASIRGGDVSTGIYLGDGASDAGSQYLFINMSPSYLGNSEISSAVTVTITDNLGGTVSKIINLTANNRITYQHGGWTKIYAQGPTVLQDLNYKTGANDSVVGLGWSAPIESGAQAGEFDIDGWNIYRSSRGPESYYFDFNAPLNGSVLIPRNKLEYADNDSTIEVSAASNGGKVFWYRIRPYIGGTYVPGYSPTTDQVVRVIVPPRNKSFVHRWMANKHICDLNNKATDSSNNYRCTYIGPGNTSSGGSNYFEVTKDFLIDRFGIGCPYTTASCTFNNPGQPIDGQVEDCFTHEYDTPIASITGAVANETIFYDRTTALCSYYTGAGWEDFQTKYTNDTNLDPLTNSGRHSNYPSIPPLTSLNQNTANYYCQHAVASVDVLYNSGGVYRNTTGHLMTRREFMVASLWPTDITHSEIMSRERGLDMRTDGFNSRCNTNSADGLNYTPAGYNSDTMPSTDGTFPLVLNGGSSTNSCQSIFGVQDMVGNSWEISADRVNCTTDTVCVGVIGGSRLDTHADMTDLFVSNGGVNYDFDDIMGPCDTNGDGNCDTSDLITFTTDSTVGQAFYYIGLPVLSSYSDGVSNYRTLGTSTLAWMHNDVSSVDAVSVNAGSNTGALLYGGSYASGGDAAGIFSSYVRPAESTSVDSSFRCINYIDN